MADGRIPCINPRCRRTAPAAKYEPGTEIICGKCFRSLPEKIRSENRHIWREVRKWERRIARTTDELKRQRMRDVLSKWEFRLRANWRAIRAAIIAPEKPEGLDAVLEELGLS